MGGIGRAAGPTTSGPAWLAVRPGAGLGPHQLHIRP